MPRAQLRRLAASLALTALIALVTIGCAADEPPRITVYSDGTSLRLAPLQYCDVTVSSCDAAPDAKGSLTTRPGLPVQISVPESVSQTPWLVNVQSSTADGKALPVRQEFFSPGETLAYTARPGSPDERLLVVEIQQLGAAYAGKDDNTPITDEFGNPQLVARGVWSVELTPRDPSSR